MKENEIIDILPEMMEINYNGVDFNEILMKSAIQSRIIRILGSKENNWLKPLFEIYKNESAEERVNFANRIRKVAKDGGIDNVDETLKGVLDLDILINVFNAIDRIKDDKDLSIPAPTKELKDITDNAETVCVMIDKVARAISANPILRGSYSSGSSSVRDIILRAELQSLDKDGKLTSFDKSERVQSLNRWLPYYTLNADNALLDTFAKSDRNNEVESQIVDSMREVVEKDEKWFEQSQKKNENDAEDMLNDEKEPELVRFGDVFPRATPQSKISKMLQPYNIKVGIKFLNQIIDAFNDVLVREK